MYQNETTVYYKTKKIENRVKPLHDHIYTNNREEEQKGLWVVC